MLRDVKTNVRDGLLGFSAESGDGLHIKIGVSPVETDSPMIITSDMDADKIKNRLGLSPLADAVMDSVQWGAPPSRCHIPRRSARAPLLPCTGPAAESGTPL